MSTICLAAQRSFQTGEAVWFSWRLILARTLVSLFCLGALIVAGMYAHIYWDLRHPVAVPKPKPARVTQPDTQISEMHYVYVSKPFPEPKPAAPIPHDLLPPPDQPVMDSDADWQRAPDADLSTEPLPAVHAENMPDTSASLKARFMQALQEQQQDYSQGKVPAAPMDETQVSAEEQDRVVNQTTSLKTEKMNIADGKKPPLPIVHGDFIFNSQ